MNSPSYNDYISHMAYSAAYKTQLNPAYPILLR